MKKLLFISAAIQFCFSVSAQECGRISIRNKEKSYPGFVVSLNGVRVGGAHGEMVTSGCLDEKNYKVKIYQEGSSQPLVFNVGNTVKYETRFLLVKDEYGNYSIAPDGKAIISDADDAASVAINVNPAQPVTPVGTLSVPSTTPAVQNQTITNITVNSSVTQVNPVNPVEALPANSNTVASVANNGFMDPATYSNLCNSLRKESVDNVKMSTAKTFITESNLSSEQVLGIVKLFNFESNRLAFAKWAYSKTVDKKNYIRVYDGLTFSSSKKDLSEYIKNNP